MSISIKGLISQLHVLFAIFPFVSEVINLQQHHLLALGSLYLWPWLWTFSPAKRLRLLLPLLTSCPDLPCLSLSRSYQMLSDGTTGPQASKTLGYDLSDRSQTPLLLFSCLFVCLGFLSPSLTTAGASRKLSAGSVFYLCVLVCASLHIYSGCLILNKFSRSVCVHCKEWFNLDEIVLGSELIW